MTTYTSAPKAPQSLREILSTSTILRSLKTRYLTSKASKTSTDAAQTDSSKAQEAGIPLNFINAERTDPKALDTMASQLVRYNLSLLDLPTSQQLSKAEAEKAYCQSCPNFSSCQYPDGQKGFKPYISVTEKQRGGQTIREIYLAHQECTHRLERKAQARNKRYFESSGVPKEYSDLTLGLLPISAISSEIAQAYEVLMILLKHLEEGTGTILEREVYLQGGPNTGKTYLASLAGNEAISRGKTVMYKTVGELLLKLRFEKESYPLELKQLEEADLVILEDLSAEIRTYSTDQILMIIDRLQREKGALIVTSQEDLETTMLSNGTPGERLRNRLKRMTKVIIE